MTPEDLSYSKTHEWYRKEGDLYVLGITDYAQKQLGDIVYVEVRDPGTKVGAGEELGNIESVKAVAPLNAAFPCEIVGRNEVLEQSPEKVNQDAYGEGWIAKVKPAGAVEGLLDAKGYEEHVKSESG